uniref:NADH:ubiquinone reductase (H(+)-translocating) n=1 Tax=Platyscapa corneri TaxID=130029 RepID=A0A8A9Y9H8_9HYME|nr:NADH dehydrogenase subunit 5 [Platyscapa corneri]
MYMFFYMKKKFFFFFFFFFFVCSLFFLFYKYSMFLEWSIMSLNSMNINMYLYFDWMTFMFMFIVMLISSMIMLYCNEYMMSDNNKVRFFYLLFFFIMSMMLMIVSPNMISILIGWDGLGLISYLLVIYYNSVSSYNSGMLTVLMNRVGDVFILLSIGLMSMYGSWNFMNYNNMDSVILLFVMISAFTKSAQFPFSSWLPAAMAAPTPVSSLVHSSTLVTAGVYLLIRFNTLFVNCELLMLYIKITGLITMMMAGFLAIFDVDLKKIIAYSTLSQLGMMMVIYGFGQFELVFFHLVIHAIFKSMMFMCSGVIIHNLMNNQDIRFMGCVSKMMPLTYMIMMISSFSLCGMPFLSGFYSKDKILEYVLLSGDSILVKLMFMLSIMLTIMYSIRLNMYLSVSINNFSPYKFCNDSLLMNLSMMFLMLMTLSFGMLMKWILFMNLESMFLSFNDKMWFYLLCIISVIIGKFLWYYDLKINNLIKIFFSSMWMMNIFVNKMIYYPLYNGVFLYYYDQLIIVYFVSVINSIQNKLNKFNSYMYTNSTFNLMMMMSVMMIVLIIF